MSITRGDSSSTRRSRPRSSRPAPRTPSGPSRSGGRTSSSRRSSPSSERTSSTNPRAGGDRVELSSASRRRPRTDSPQRTSATERTSQPTAAERRRATERGHISNLDQNFQIFDNPGGGDTDGTVSRGDIEKVANGEYNRERAEERLIEAGVPRAEVDERLQGLEDTADFLLENDSVRDRLDVANDNDGNGDTDGKIARGDLDRVMVTVEQENREARVREADRAAEQPPSEAHIREAQTAIDRWTEPGALSQELGERDLSEFSPAELDALAAVNDQNPQAKRNIEQAVLRSVDSAESLDDLPTGDAFSYLLQDHVTGQEVRGNEAQRAVNPTAVAQRQLDGLVRDEIESSLDSRLEDRRGDGGLDLALERVSGDLEDLAIDNPALVGSIQSQAEATFNDYGEEFTEVARRDDNVLQRANHAVTGGVRAGVGFVADGFRFAVDVTARVNSLPTRVGGRLANAALDLGGRAAGAGLDAVGANGAADRVRQTSDSVGNALQDGADFLADQNENFTRGLGESVAGAAEGIAYAATDPLGTVQGIGQVIQDPSLLVEGYRETAQEHGIAGAAGQVTGDVLLTVFTGGGGAAARGASAAGRVANIAGRGGRVANFAARGATRTQSFLDDAGRAGGLGRHALDRLPFNGNSAARGVDVPGGRGRIPSTLDRARRRVDEALGGDTLETTVRRADAVREANPQLFEDIAGVRERFGTVYDEAPNGDRITNPARLRKLLDEEVGLARRLDEVSAGNRPSGVGDILLEGRENILNHLRKNFDDLNPDAVRRIARGLFADSDPSAPAYLTRLRPRDRVFRAFDSTAKSADGSYFGRRVDRRLTPEENIANNALGVDNLADRGAVLRVGEESLALVTRVGSQLDNPKFAATARGGGWQLQFLDNTSLSSRLSSLTDDLVRTPRGVKRANPGEYIPIRLPLPVAAGLTQLEEPHLP